jgi:hypothetical protein
MAEYKYLNQAIVDNSNSITLTNLQSDVDLDPVNLLKGVRLSSEPGFVNFMLSGNSGDFYPDVFKFTFHAFLR